MRAGLFIVCLILSGAALAQGGGTAATAKMPPEKVCVNRSNIYTEGAVVKMNEKPYACKRSEGDKRGQGGGLKWVPMKKQ